MAENPEIQEETVLSSDLISGAVRAFIRSQWRVLHRVPAHVRRDKKYVYEPAMVPLGPYHSKEHPQSHLVEPLKNQLLDMDCMGADHKSFLLSMISERIDEIRHFYGGAHGYDDKELAEMMLRDACFLKFYMKPQLTQFVLVRHCLGMGGDLFMVRDSFMLENQIPLWLISLIYPDYKSLLCYYLSGTVFGDERMKTLPWENGVGREPTHLFEALICAYLSPHETRKISTTPNSFWVFKKYIPFFKKYIPFFMRYIQAKEKKSRSRTTWQMINNSFRSATDLKAKGVHFRRSSNCLTDIKFFSFAFYAELHLPFFYITYNSMVFFSNAIAFEMSPEAGYSTYGMTTYFTFMKTLIHNVNDIKVLMLDKFGKIPEPLTGSTLTITTEEQNKYK